MNMNMNNSMIYGNDTNVMIADRIISHCIASHSIMNCCLLQLVSSLVCPTFVVFIVFHSVLLLQETPVDLLGASHDHKRAF